MTDDQNSENKTQIVKKINYAFLIHLCKILSKKAQEQI